MIKKLHLKSLLLIAALLVGSSSAWATDKTINAGALTNGVLTDSPFTLTFSKGNGSNSPIYYSSNDCSEMRLYASNTVEVVSTGGNMTQIVFTLSDQGKKRLAPITASVGSISTQASGDETVTWTGNATTVIFTVGEKANYGSDGDTKAGQLCFTKVDITYTPGQVTIPVTGVTVAPTELTMNVGEEATLTATVAPSTATNKNVNWESSDDDVVMVDDEGNLLAISEGEATITVTTVDGNKTATCDVTVKIPAALTLDFSTNILNLPDGSSNKTTDSNGYSYNGYTYTLAGGGTSNGYYMAGSGNAKYLIMGKTGCTLTFPEYPFKVTKIKVYGNSGASANAKFNIYVGSTAICNEATSSKVDHEFAIPSAYQTGAAYSIQATAAYNMQITKIEIFGDAEPIAVSEHGFATFASDNVLDFTNVPDITAYIAKEESGAITLTKVNKVPAGTGVLLRSDNGTTAFAIPFTTAATDNVTGNLFVRGTGAAVSYGSGPYNYVLSIVNNKIGFYKANNNTVATNRAYLQTTIAAGARIEIDGMTGISSVNLNENQNENRYYDLQGRHVAQPTKGLYILNGRKVVIK